MDIEQGSDNGGKKPDGVSYRPLMIWVVLAVGVLLILGLGGSDSILVGKPKQLTYDELVESLNSGRVKSLKVDKGAWTVLGEFSSSGQSTDESTKFTCTITERDFTDFLRPLLINLGVKFELVPPSHFWEAMAYILPWLVLGLILYVFFFRHMKGAGGGGILSFGKSRAVRLTREDSKKTFKDVAGIDEAREEVVEIIEFLRTPQKFERLGGRLPKGVLLIGQPGTGKTLLAKAIAGEADRPFFSISGSDFVEMFVGVGASRVRDLFEQAKANSPCIVFLDEIDAVGRKRMNDLPGSGVETAQTLNAILVEMDGVSSADKVIVIAATNRPDVLDPALLRPGRFDRRIVVDLPDIKGREAILKVHVKDIKLAENVDLSVLARGTPSFSGAELENLVNEAALIGVMNEKEAVDMACFEEARDKVRWGKAKHSRKMSEDDRRATAYHEAGHALLMRLLPHVSPLHKVSIIPRGMALGATMQLPEKDEYSMGRKRILGEITVRLGGRAAEELFLDDVTNGASHDLEQATGLARSMVCEWGMSDKLGLVRYADRGGHGADGGLFEGREFSEDTARRIDDEVHAIIDARYTEAISLLKDHSEDMALIVDGLMEFETLSSEDVGILLEEKSMVRLREMHKIAAASGKYNPEEEEVAADAKLEAAPESEEETGTDSTESAPVQEEGDKED